MHVCGDEWGTNAIGGSCLSTAGTCVHMMKGGVLYLYIYTILIELVLLCDRSLYALSQPRQGEVLPVVDYRFCYIWVLKSTRENCLTANFSLYRHWVLHPALL